MSGWEHGEADDLERRFLLLALPKRKGLPSYAGPHGEAPGSARRQTGAKGKHRSQLLLCFPHKVKQGRGNSLALTSLNNVGGLYAIGVVSSCLVPGSGLI